MRFLRTPVLLFGLLLPAPNTHAQDTDISRMGHFKLRAHLKEHGYKTASGNVIHVGDTLYVGKGTLPDKRYAFIYQSPTGALTQSSLDGSVKAYLQSGARGRKAIVKAFMTSGMRKGEYSIFAVVGVAEPYNYWIEPDNAIEAAEITFKK